MKKYPIGIQTFEQLIQDDYLYIDKTAFVYKMIHEGKAYFLSRPRRFGKSLFLSTLKAVFEGKRKLFEGLHISSLKYTWDRYQVWHIDFSKMQYKVPGDVDTFLLDLIEKKADETGITIQTSKPAELIFGQLVEKMSARGKLVILIDEYDKPVLDTIDNLSICREIQSRLKGFYTALKANDEYFRFIFLTGVSKFAKISVFSGLNNLNDITMHFGYSSVCGYTQNEFDTYFYKEIKELASTHGLNEKKVKEKIKSWYNGFRFSPKSESLYNPVSIYKLFDIGRFDYFWFETATPTFLINLIKKRDYPIGQMEKLQIAERNISTFEIEQLQIEPLLFQTGYLTIKDFDHENQLYTLSYPNIEVKKAFLYYLIDAFSLSTEGLSESYLERLLEALHNNSMEDFFSVLQVFYANIPYDLQVKNEKYYQTILYIVFTLIGFRIKAEHTTNKGRIDAVIETETNIYIIEFKLFDTAENALKQIKEKEYFQMFTDRKKSITLVGVEFSAIERNIHRWLVESYREG